MIEADLVIVGAGPAGLAAAAVKRLCPELQVLVLDENPLPGGQYLRSRHPAVAPPGSVSAKTAALRAEFLAEAGAGGVQFVHNATVWGSFEPQVLAVDVAGRLELVRWQALIIAMGASERTIPFPGWTLPGVMTAGGAQTLVKSQGVLPGRRVLVAGAGPFLFPVAQELATAGAEVAGLLQAVSRSAALPYLWRGLAHWQRIGEAFHYLRSLRSLKVPVRFGRAVVGALGKERVEAAVISAVDANWKPIPGTEETVPCDTICLGYGFLPQTDLARLLGAEMRYNGLRGGWVPRCDADGRTTVPGLYAAGEVAGIGGAHAAIAEGRLAGLAAARSLGALDAAKTGAAEARLREEGRRAHSFTDLMLALFEVKPGILAAVTDETPVCRCEGATGGQIRTTIADWTADLPSIKIFTRAGMGLCQGRTCTPTVREMITEATGVGPERIPPLSVRSPLKAVPGTVLAQLAEIMPVPEGGDTH